MAHNLNISKNILISYINVYYCTFLLVYTYFLIKETKLVLITSWHILLVILAFMIIVSSSIYLKKIIRDFKIPTKIKNLSNYFRKNFERLGLDRETFLITVKICKILTISLLLIITFDSIFYYYKVIVAQQIYYITIYIVTVLIIIIPYFVINDSDL